MSGPLIAWVLVRDRFAGKAFINTLIDLPFALPTIVAGLTLMALYGPSSPVGIDVAFSKAAVREPAQTSDAVAKPVNLEPVDMPAATDSSQEYDRSDLLLRQG